MALFSSPFEQASTSLYNAAISGRPIGEDLLRRRYAQARQSLEQSTSARLAGTSGDILSRYASAGILPGSGVEGVIAKANQSILGQSQQAEAQLSAEEQSQLMNLILNQLSLGLSGMSKSSIFGDVLGGLTTLGNLALGGVKLYNAISNPSAYTKDLADAKFP